ncbi:CUE domain-containing protein 2 [Arctopsyche grandis]|uniref:CUE domain-containing protein 2 n=1 Tax=Arctopsyche grandis TaxID=121162 RepID=UPI00406D6397
MSTIAEQETLVKESLFQFVTKNIPSADLNLIDEIVLSYVTSILEEASREPCFDVEGFVEMMSAYFPEFTGLDSAIICSWIFDLVAELTNRASTTNGDCRLSDGEDAERISLTLQSLSEMLPTITPRSHSNSESSDKGVPEKVGKAVPAAPVYPAQCLALQDMFPNTCPIEIQQCVSIACGDVERAAGLVLHRRESGQARAAPPLPPPPPRPHHTLNDTELKSRIINRYSYVDKSADLKEHKPLAPKIEPKKMVRYRDNKIVSLKGERYTEVSRSGTDEEASLKKPKRPHCPP